VRVFESPSPVKRRRGSGWAIALIIAGALLAFGPTLAINLSDDYVAHLRDAETSRWMVRHLAPPRARSSDQVDAPIITPGTEGYLLEIPRLGLRLVVHMLEPAVLQGTNTPTLRHYGLGQVPYTAMLRDVSPGGDGTAVIAGHRTTHGAPFRHLDELRPGDGIILRQGGKIQHWRVASTGVILPTDLNAIRSHPGDRQLVLLACTPPFSSRERLMIDARPAHGVAARADGMKEAPR
jgi:LPXTG-site transpeptidase (sortase) family protein